MGGGARFSFNSLGLDNILELHKIHREFTNWLEKTESYLFSLEIVFENVNRNKAWEEFNSLIFLFTYPGPTIQDQLMGCFLKIFWFKVYGVSDNIFVNKSGFNGFNLDKVKTKKTQSKTNSNKKSDST